MSSLIHSGGGLGGRKGQDGLDPRLEKVKALLSSIRKNEKLNALDFEIVDEKEKKEERDHRIGKEAQGRSEGRSEDLSTERGAENEGSQPAEREREREYEPERGGMEMGM